MKGTKAIEVTCPSCSALAGEGCSILAGFYCGARIKEASRITREANRARRKAFEQ